MQVPMPILLIKFIFCTPDMTSLFLFCIGLENGESYRYVFLVIFYLLWARIAVLKSSFNLDKTPCIYAYASMHVRVFVCIYIYVSEWSNFKRLDKGLNLKVSISQKPSYEIIFWRGIFGDVTKNLWIWCSQMWKERYLNTFYNKHHWICNTFFLQINIFISQQKCSINDK